MSSHMGSPSGPHYDRSPAWPYPREPEKYPRVEYPPYAYDTHKLAPPPPHARYGDYAPRPEYHGPRVPVTAPDLGQMQPLAQLAPRPTTYAAASSIYSSALPPGVYVEDGYTKDTQRGYELYIPSASRKKAFSSSAVSLPPSSSSSSSNPPPPPTVATLPTAAPPSIYHPYPPPPPPDYRMGPGPSMVPAGMAYTVPYTVRDHGDYPPHELYYERPPSRPVEYAPVYHDEDPYYDPRRRPMR
ncbi:uncharacterized protein V1510DRAFT_416946 [Dipodascopsis tothii]|uniref:uncharacterized protein n=1 Tax=Dipodascopsis tothii TaxID=44089 RepID=UPI0034CF6066